MCLEVGDDTRGKWKSGGGLPTLQRPEDFMRLELAKKSYKLSIGVFGEPPSKRGQLPKPSGIVRSVEKQLVQLRSMLHHLDVSLGVKLPLQLWHEVKQVDAPDVVIGAGD